MSAENAVIKKSYTDTILNWALKGAGIFAVIVVVQTAFGYLVGALDPNLGITFTTQIWPIQLQVYPIVSLILSAIAVGGSAAYVNKIVDENVGKSRRGSFAVSRLVRPKTRRAVSKDAKILLALVIIAAVAFYGGQQANVTKCPTGQTLNASGVCTMPTTGGYSYQASITLSITDALAGGASSPSSVNVYTDPTQPAIDSITISSGKGTSGLSSYTSGSTVWLKIVDATTKILYWVPETIPFSNSLTAPSTWGLGVQIESPPATATITASINSTSEATNAVYNVTGQSNTTPTLNVVIQNPTTNRGLVPTPGPDLLPSGTNWELGAYVLLGNDSAYKAVLNGPTKVAQLSSNDVRFYETLPSGPNSFTNSMGSFDRVQTASGSWKGTGGAVTMPLAFNLQGLTPGGSGQNVTCTIVVYAFTSSYYYVNHGYQYGPSAVLLGTYILNFVS